MNESEDITVEFLECAMELIDDCIKQPNALWVQISNHKIPDEDRPWNVEQPNCDEFPIKILFMQDALEDRQLLKYLKNRVIRSGQVNAIMYHYPEFEPNLKDIVRWQGKDLVVRAIDPVQPVDTPIIYILEFGT